jgi:23S rRNA (guanosine2251-2'-O)-methyltransferase
MQQPSQSNIIIGRKPVLEAFEKGKNIDKLLLQSNVSGELIGDILRAAKLADVYVQRVPVPKLNSMTRSNHQGVIAIGAMVNYFKLQDIIDQCFADGRNPQFIWLDGITDVRNIGAIARTAQCFDLDGIIVTEKGNAAINEEAVKTSAGAILHTTIIREKHSHGVIDILKANGLKLYASSLQATKSISELDFKEPCVVVLGSEENGVSEQVYKACNDQFIIPMGPKFDSLNVSVANGIICNEMFKQKG